MNSSNITILEPKECKIYEFEKQQISALSELIIKKKQDKIEKEKEVKQRKFKSWYKENRYDLNTIFNNIMTWIDNNYIPLNTDKQKIYDKFIEYTFEKSEVILFKT